MRKEEFTIESRDGHRTKIHCVSYIPEGQPVAILQIVHGMAEYIERYEEFATWLTERGVLVTGEDHLGHGKTAQSPSEYGFFCEQDPATVLVRDVHRLKKTVEEQYPSVPYFIMGHSMGSFIVRNYLCKYGTGIKAAIIMGTGMTPLALLRFSKFLASMQSLIFGAHHKAEMINALAFGGYTSKIPHAKTHFDWLSVNEENVKAYQEDPACGFTFTVNGFKTMFELIHRLHLKENLEKMPKDLPVYFISGEDDPVGDYGKAVKNVVQSFQEEYGMGDVSMTLIPGGRHEILNESYKEEVYQDVYDYLVSVMNKKTNAPS